MRTRALLAALALLAVYSLAACEPGPDCKHWATAATLTPVFNGKTTSLHMGMTTYCAEWAPSK